MPSAVQIIAILDKTGHLRFPFGTAQVVPPPAAPDYPKDLQDPRVVKGVASYQSMYAPELSPLVAKHYPDRTQPVVRVDGLVGPATEELFDQPRCECPDYTAYSFAEKALGNGGWKGCNGATNFHGCVIQEMNDPPDHIKPHWDEIKRRATTALARAGFKVTFSKTGGNVSLTWVPSSDGWIGLATVGNRAETCQSPIANRWMRLLSTYTQGWADIQRKIHAIVLLVLHEFGHVQSLQHSTKSIMNAYLDESRPADWIGVGDAYEATFRQMYGPDPIPQEPGPGPGPGPGPNPPPPPGSGYWPKLLLIDEATGKKYRAFPLAEV